MSETRNLRHPEPGDVDTWRAAFDELDLRMDALRQAFMDGVRSFNMTDEIVERIHCALRRPRRAGPRDALHVSVRGMARAGGLPLRAGGDLRERGACPPRD